MVARLLQGKTYRTIASELIIVTVTTHVKNIYSKLQVRNRVKNVRTPVVSFYVIDYRQTSMKTTDVILTPAILHGRTQHHCPNIAGWPCCQYLIGVLSPSLYTL